MGGIEYLQKKNLQYISGTYICYHLLSFKSMFTLLYVLSPSWKQYCVEMAMPKVLTDGFV